MPLLDSMPLTPLETLRQFLGLNPWHFWGFSGTDAPVESNCLGIYYEYPWQLAEGMSRAEMRAALCEAERKLHDVLNFHIAPAYSEVTQPYPRPGQQWLRWGTSGGPDNRWLPVTLLTEGFIQALGVEQLTAIQAAAPVTFSDADGDGIQDTFTVGPIATTVTDPLQIAVYFAATERWDGSGVGERWRVQPVRVSISGGFVTITGSKWLLGKPALYERYTMRMGVDNDGLDLATAANFASTLDVYRRNTNQDGTTIATSQGVLTWETPPWPWGCCSGPTASDSSSDPAAIATAVARVGVRNAEQGIVLPGEATYDSTTGIWSSSAWDRCRQPDRVTVRTYAGYPLDSRTTSPTYGQVDPKWAALVCTLAASELTCPSTACSGVKRSLEYWQTDMARTDSAQGVYQISPSKLATPWGTRRGQIEVWRRIQDDYHTLGFTPG